MNTTSSKDGPYLTAALICEKVLQEKDGAVSVIRIVDRITQTFSAALSSENLPPIQVNLAALIAFKSGNAHGRHMVQWTVEAPSGLKIAEQNLPVLFEGEDRGVNLVLNLNMTLNLEGVYWFGVSLENQLLTKIPLRILYQPIGPNP